MNSAELADRIAHDINTGELTSGTWLKQVDLEQRYQSSRAGVRKALDQLVSERLVEHVPNRGYHVCVLDKVQRRHIDEIRAVLESAAAADIVVQATVEDIHRLRSLATVFEEMIFKGSLLQQYEANLAFHRELLSKCTNRELVALAFAQRGRVAGARIGQWATRELAEHSSREHFAMIDAVERRDGEGLAQLIRQHILK
ncbi:GntR family transcriptional regulator [Halotalea alkalilenta]|uniref:GntR family transcriptional regulator n=1 Tax=Halotalea alkalilenta TaxID=376489 RepID=UPI000481BC6B|nr:GntR family transcriptional regulator [Halotalea alkalilenta]